MVALAEPFLKYDPDSYSRLMLLLDLTRRTPLVVGCAPEATVVVMTCASSGNRNLLRGLGAFPLLVLDEAAQCVEPGPLVPLSLGSERLVAIGDERQLPATVLDRTAANRGFGCSFFERCVRDRIVSEANGFVQLDEQRRMHPSISKFPASHFYEGVIKNSEVVLSRRQLPGFPWPDPNGRVCFVDVKREGEGDRDGGGQSRMNQPEAKMLVRTLKGFLLAGVDPADIAVITGYSAQRSLLQQLVSDLSPAAQAVRVDTVDAFQGAERELVLVSAVRANQEQGVGFMRDPRRMNVLLTRARCGLVVFGDGRTLEGDSAHWRPWLEHVKEQGWILRAGDLAEDIAPHPSKDTYANAGDPHSMETPEEVDEEDGWTSYIDPGSGKVWHWHEATQKVVWAS